MAIATGTSFAVLPELFILRGVPGYIRSDNVVRREEWHG